MNIDHLKYLRMEATASPWMLDSNSLGDAFGLRSSVHGHARIGTHIDWAYLLALNEAAPELFALVDKVAELEHEIHGLEEQVLDLGTDLDRLNSENDELMETMGEIQTLCAEYPGLIPTDIYQIATSALKEKA